MPIKKLCRWILPAALALGSTMSAIAQDVGTRSAAPSESITVTGIKDVEAAVKKFVENMTVPTRMAGKLARWKDGLCPMAVELPPEVAKLLIKRVRDAAVEVGAPVNDKDPCPANIEIVFTTAPQILLDDIRVMRPIALGYHDNSAQAEKLATVTRPIQSWYTTATVDVHGHPQVDAARKGGVSMRMEIPIAGAGGTSLPPEFVEMNFPNAIDANVTGSRLGDGLSSALSNILIVADPSKLLNREIDALADYIAMLALSQVQAPENCQDLPSILNLLVPDCSRTTKALTSGDIAYLRALYKITPTAGFRGQRDEMMYQMEHALKPENK